MKIENRESGLDQENEIEESNGSGNNSEEKVEVKGEFNISIRKLEIPVRPRGVLAE